MRGILEYISNNTFLTTIFGVIIGGIISSMSTIYINSKERKERRKDYEMRENTRKYENKAELKIKKVLEKSNNKANLEIFLIPYKIEYTDNFKTYNIKFPKNIDDIKKHKYKEFRFKNVGNADINELYICSTLKNIMIVEYNNLENFIRKKYTSYSECYDRKIFRGEEFTIRVYYSEEYEICNIITSTLQILYRDSFDKLYKQAFWYDKDNLYEPYPLNYDEYRDYIVIDKKSPIIAEKIRIS